MKGLNKKSEIQINTKLIWNLPTFLCSPFSLFICTTFPTLWDDQELELPALRDNAVLGW